MADEEKEPQRRPRRIKKKGLPPISPRETKEDENIKPVKRKVKKKAQSVDETTTESDGQPIPVRRRKRSPSQNKMAAKGDAGAGDTSVDTPKKKKKRPKPTEGKDQDESQNLDSPKPRDGQGSKTSLISKDEDTPQKKTGIKKKKKVKKSVVPEDDEYRDSPWAEDLRTMHDDIISGNGDGDADGVDGIDGEKTSSKKMTKMFVTAPILKSQPLDKIFVETSSKFKGQMKSMMKKQHYEDPSVTALPAEVSRTTTADFAISTNAIFRTISLFLHGLTAGLALWQMVIIFVLTSFPSDDFLEHYYETAMPLQGCFYFLLAVCTVSVCDRFDIGNPNRRFVLRAITMQNGAVSILFCLAALILNVVCIRYEDQMSLYKDYTSVNATVTPGAITTPLPELVKDDDISIFRGINTARSVLIVLSWFVLSITPNCDRLGQNLRSGRTGLEKEVEMDKVSSA